MSSSKKILAGILVLLIDLLVSIFIFTVWQKPDLLEKWNLNHNINPGPNLTNNSLPNNSKFTLAKVSSNSVIPQQSQEITCNLELPPSYKYQYVLISQSNLLNIDVSANKIFKVPSKNVSLTPNGATTTIKFTLPDTFPQGQYIGRLDIFSPEYELENGCSTNTFTINSQKPIVLISSLDNPTGQENIIPTINQSSPSLTFKINGSEDFSNLIPEIVIKSYPDDQIIFRKKLEKISISRDLAHNLTVPLNDFIQKGIFSTEIELSDINNSKVSISPLYLINYGITPQITAITIVSQDSAANSLWKANITYREPPTPSSDLTLYTELNDNNGVVTGQSVYPLQNEWPKNIEIKKNTTAEISSISVIIKKKGIFDKSIYEYRQKL